MTTTKKIIENWTERIIYYSAYVYFAMEHRKDKAEKFEEIFMKRADRRCGRMWSVVAKCRDSGTITTLTHYKTLKEWNDFIDFMMCNVAQHHRMQAIEEGEKLLKKHNIEIQTEL